MSLVHPIGNEFDQLNAMWGTPVQDAMNRIADRRTTVQAPAGRKDDGGKLDVTLLFEDLPHALEGVAEVLQWAITKKAPVPYERGSWQGVAPFQRRYAGAQLRHELNRAKARLEGVASEPLDAETGLMELQHIATDALFRLEMAMRKARGLNVPEGA